MVVYKDINVCHFIHSVRPANRTILNIFCYPEKNQTLHMQFSPLHIYIYLTILRGNLWKIYQKAVKDVRSVYYSERFSEIMNICGYDVNVMNSMYRSCTWIWLAWKICNPHLLGKCYQFDHRLRLIHIICLPLSVSQFQTTNHSSLNIIIFLMKPSPCSTDMIPADSF